jgi:hypothetical protein
MGDLTANFDKRDFQCRCPTCAADGLRPATKISVVEAVQRIRDAIGSPLVVSRGVSCASHNEDIGGAKDSRHLPEHADAVDIVTFDSAHAAMIVMAAIKDQTFTTFLVEAHHIHLDARPGPRRFLAAPEYK